MISSALTDEHHVLQCMDLWSGNCSVENEASTPGVEIYVFSEPYRGESTGGDVHYVSLCAGGIVTRLILADVSGHGAAVADTSRTLRSLMCRFMNAKRQDRLVRNLNREFTELASSGRFATAIVATYLSHRNRFMICNAGHPRPLWYRRETDTWSYVNEELVDSGEAFNLPLGLDAATAYQQFELNVGEGDLLVLYTDAFTEAHGTNGRLLGEEGLKRLVTDLPTDHVRTFGRGLLTSLTEFAGNAPAQDDVSLLVLRFAAARRRRPGMKEKLNAYAKMAGLKPI